MFGSDIGTILCDATVKENADEPDNLAAYKTTYEHLAADLKTLGPQAAKRLVLQYTQNATQADPKPAATLFCLKLKTLDIAKLAESKGTVPKYAGLIGGNQQQVSIRQANLAGRVIEPAERKVKQLRDSPNGGIA
jgi:hypothetical protein